MSLRQPDPGGASDAEILSLVRADHGNPFALLGPHQHEGGRWIVRCFQPGTSQVHVIDRETGEELAELTRLHDDGFYAGLVPGSERPDYRLKLDRAWAVDEVEDPYRFPPVLGDVDVHLLGEGTHLENYERLGAHLTSHEGVTGVGFAVWAPNARRVSVVGPFNNWDGRVHPMRLRHGIGVWEIFIPGLSKGTLYKFEVRGEHGNVLPLKADPFAHYMEQPPGNAGIVHAYPDHPPKDAAWVEGRATRQSLGAPISIYEVHLGSWKRGEGNRYLTWRELADDLAHYCHHMGFTHVELLPISEHPFDGSWGYQPIGLYAPTSRFGPPEDFRHFVETLHGHEIGVLIDWVPGHFPTDSHGLGRFDGSALYEHADPRQGFHRDWNTLIYNYGRTEVINFLLGNALFWFDKYRIDGLRVDAVASMLYLDYSREAGEWIPNRHGGRENLEAIEFLKRMNIELHGRFPGATTFAEESTAFPAVSKPTHDGGLGFGFKWNMGWMHDTLSYMQEDPVHRKYHHNKMTFGLLYQYSEHFVLPLSHDEVVHGKGSLINKMPGDDWQKFANLRAYYGWMWGFPGKKLLFMGGEFAQWAEWNHNASLDWHLCTFERHKGMQDWVRDLNHLLKREPALHSHDSDPHGFHWLEAEDGDNSCFAFLRRGNGRDVVVASNFTPVPREGYRIGVPEGGRWVELLNSDASGYGGSNVGNGAGLEAEAVPHNGQPCSIMATLPPLATIFLARG